MSEGVPRVHSHFERQTCKQPSIVLYKSVCSLILFNNCLVISFAVLSRLFQFLGDDGVGEEDEVEEGETGLTNVDYIAIALGLGLTSFIVVSMAVLVYKAEKRRKHDKLMKRWRVIVKGSVSTNSC